VPGEMTPDLLAKRKTFLKTVEMKKYSNKTSRASATP
jgi:hypothetical protein